MPVVQFAKHLSRFFPDLEDGEKVAGDTVAAIIAALEARHPGFADYIVDDRGVLREHVNIFVGGEPVQDRERLSDPVPGESRVFILQALSGG